MLRAVAGTIRLDSGAIHLGELDLTDHLVAGQRSALELD